MVGNAIQFARDPFPFLRRCHREHGPLFELKLLGQRVALFAGAEANLFLKDNERTHFAAAPAFERLGRALETERFLSTLDGPPHKQLRNAINPAVTRKQMEGYVPKLEAVSRAHLQRWIQQGPLDIREQLKRLVYEQLGGVLTNIDANEYYEDVVRVFDTAVRVGVTRMWPAFLSNNPWNLRSRRRTRELAQRLMDSAADGVRIPDLVAKAVEAGVLPEDDLLATLLAPYFAGIDTVASSLSFACYAVAAHPEATARVRAELDEMPGPLSVDGLRKLPSLRAFVLETLRCHPVTSLSMRHTTQPVEFAGFTLPAGHPCAFALPLTLKLSEHYPDPDRFDLDRFPNGKSTAAPGVFLPYGTGPHVCLGAGLADMQMLAFLATLIRDYALDLHPCDYQLRQKLDPLPSPKGLRVVVRPRASSTARDSHVETQPLPPDPAVSD